MASATARGFERPGDPRATRAVRLLRRGVAAAALALACAAAAAAQEPARPAASPFLPAGHWAVEAARRLDAMGLAPAGYDAADLTPTRDAVARLLEHAAARADSTGAPAGGLAAAWHERFLREFPQEAPRLGGGALRYGGWVTAGVAGRSGAMSAGTGYNGGIHEWTGGAPVADASWLDAGSYLSLDVGSVLAVAAAGVSGPDGLDAREAYAVTGWRSVGVWAGRRAPGARPGRGGGLVLDGAVPFDGGGVFLRRPVTLPWALRHLGPVRFDLFVAKLDRNGRLLEPWFGRARGTLSPHPRLTLGVSRAAVFAGEGTTGTRPIDFLKMLVGKKTGVGGEWDNQLFSADVSWRPPLGALPLRLYWEQGMEDDAGGWRDVPGFVAGAEVAALPGAPALAASLEYASFAPSCCGNPIWYQHWEYQEGWTRDGVPLAHPLGGHGTELRLGVRADLLGARLRLAASPYRRERGRENLYAPAREGVSHGVDAELGFLLRPGFELVGRGELEAGEAEWTRAEASAGARVVF